MVSGDQWEVALKDISIGETRAVTKATDAIAWVPGLLRHRILSPHDKNRAPGVTKGRSPAPNSIAAIRKKAARALATGVTILLPWVQKQPEPS